MKLIDLLNERAKLAAENFHLSFNALFLPAGCTEKQKDKNREYQNKAKRYNELTDRINEAYVKTRLSVVGYGDISLATAICYYQSSLMCFDGADVYELANLLLAVDYQKDVIDSASWYVDETITPKPLLGMPILNDEEMRASRERQDKINALHNERYYALQLAIITAITDTEV